MTCSFFPFLAANEKAMQEKQKRRGKMVKGASSQRQRATLGSSFGPNDNPKEAVSSAHSARKVRHFRVLGAVMGWRNEKRKHTRASFACAKIQQNGAKCKSGRKNTNKEKRKKHCPYRGKWRGRFPGNGRRMPPQRGASFGMNCFVNLKSRVGCQLV